MIIYLFLVGKTPFKSNSECTTFDKILAGEYEIPTTSKVPPEAADLIGKLLRVDPYERLGAGPVGSDNDIEVLKAHPFFAGIDFSQLHLMNAPIVSKTIKLSPRPLQFASQHSCGSMLNEDLEVKAKNKNHTQEFATVSAPLDKSASVAKSLLNSPMKQDFSDLVRVQGSTKDEEVKSAAPFNIVSNDGSISQHHNERLLTVPFKI